MSVQGSLDKLYYIDEQASGGRTWVHTLHPAAKLVVAALYIIAVTSRAKYGLSGVLELAVLPALITSLSRLPAGFLLSRSLLALPPVALVGVFNLFLDMDTLFVLGGMNISGGSVSFLTLLLKGYLCLFMLLVFSVSSGIDGVTCALSFFRLPSAFILPVVLVYRYIFILLGEALLMTQAYSLRGAGKAKGIEVHDWGSFAGGLLLRSFNHSENLTRAMLMRCWTGGYAPSDRHKGHGVRSLLFIAGCSVFILFCVII